MAVDADIEFNRLMMLKGLEDAVWVMAQPAPIQLPLFTDGDEMAFEFQGWYEPAVAWGYLDQWTDEERTALIQLKAVLNEINALHDPQLWTGEALECSPWWERVRIAAQHVMATLHWSMELRA